MSVNEFEGLFLKTGQGSFEPVFKSLESLIHTYDDDEMRFISRPFIKGKNLISHRVNIMVILLEDDKMFFLKLTLLLSFWARKFKLFSNR